MELTTSFTVVRPVDEVWTALTDLGFVATCVPGAAVTEADEDGTFAGTLAVRMGSIQATFDGTARFEQVDPSARRVRLVAGGTSGLGDARLTLRGAADAVDGGTRVTLDTDVELSGRLAQLGHGVGVRVTERLIERMAETLESRLTGDTAAPAPSDELSLFEIARSALPPGVLRPLRLAGVFLAGVATGWIVASILRRVRES